MTFRDRIAQGGTIIGDGAIGTMLMERGLKLGECPELLNLEQPQVLEQVAQLYLEAGAELITTNTFGGSALKLADYNLEQRTEEINRRAVEAVRKVVGDRAWVSASCGPCGKILKPYGDTEPETVQLSFERQIGALIEAGADVICIETMIDLNEARLAVRAARKQRSDIPLIVTMTFDETPRGFYTIMGTTIEQAAKELAEEGADIIGSNCGNGSDKMVKIAEELRRLTDLPLIIQANAGLPETRLDKVVYPESPEYMAERARRLIDIGVQIIGGCCGTTPEHVAALRALVDQ